jgi:hypothetical protein
VSPESAPNERGRRRRTAVASAVLVVGVLAAGAAIRLDNWWRAPSLWVDELRLANNVAERPLPRLLGERLRYGYLVPPGYLTLQRAAFLAAGRSERGLRLVPLAAALAGLAAAAALARRVLGAEPALLAAALLSFSAPLTAFANDDRPYALDLALGALLPLAALAWLERPDLRRTFWLALLCAATPLLSYGGAVAGAGLVAGLGGVVARSRQPRLRRGFAVALLALLAAGALAAIPLWLAQRPDAGGRLGLDQYWTAAGGFAPEGSTAVERARWLLGRWVALARFPFMPLSGRLAPDWLLGVALAAGAVVLLVRRRAAGVLLASVLAAGLLAGALGVYPLTVRLSLCHAPAAALLFAALLLPVRAGRWGAAAALAVGVTAAAWAGAEAWRRERGHELQPGRSLVAALAERVAPGDRLYVGYAAEPAWRFYAPVFGLDPERAALGSCGAPDPAAELPLAGALPGTRLWLLFSNALPAERAWLLERVRGHGRPLDRLDLTGRRRTAESLEGFELDGTLPAPGGRSSPPPRLAAWRCVFFEPLPQRR